MRSLASWLIARLPKHVIGHICHGEPLLVRYNVFHTRWLRVYLHNLRRSDIDRDMHDHPWWFFSIILTGTYAEHTPSGIKHLKAGNLLFRPAHWVHNLELSKPMWTLVIAGPKSREWGFHGSTGWIHWKSYDSIGRNCE